MCFREAIRMTEGADFGARRCTHAARRDESMLRIGEE
jgi:hypothetical protein